MCNSHPFTLIVYQVDEIHFGDIWLRRSNRVFLSKEFLAEIFKKKTKSNVCENIYDFFCRQTFDADIRLVSNGFCKLHKFLVFWNGHSIAMILVTMTTKRFIQICFPHQTRINLEKKNLVRILLVLILFCACLNGHFWWTYSLYTEDNKKL